MAIVDGDQTELLDCLIFKKKQFMQIWNSLVCILTLTVSVQPCCASYDQIWAHDFDRDGINSIIATMLQKKKSWGFINKAGKFVIAPQFDLVQEFSGGAAGVAKAGRCYRIDKNGKAVSAPKSAIDFRGENNTRRWAREAAQKAKRSVRKYVGDIWDATGTVRIAKSTEVKLSDFAEGLAVCSIPASLLPMLDQGQTISAGAGSKSIPPEDQGNNLNGYIDTNGRLVIAPQFYRAYDFENGVAKVERWLTSMQPNASQGGFINKSGELIGGRFFQNTWDFENGFFVFSSQDNLKDESNWGFVRADGKQIGGSFKRVRAFSDGLAAVQLRNGLWGFIDGNGESVIAPQFESVEPFSEGLACVKVKERFGFIDKTGKFIVAPTLLDADEFVDGLAPAAVAISDQAKLKTLTENLEHRCGFIDLTGNVVIPLRYCGARPFSEGLAAVQDGLRWGYIDCHGKSVIRPQFDDARPFSEGLASVLKDHKWGFIDKAGRCVIRPQFPEDLSPGGYKTEAPSSFSEGLALAADSDSHFHFIDRRGQMAIPNLEVGSSLKPNASPFSEGLACLIPIGSSSYLSGYINRTGSFQIAPQFSDVRQFSEGLAAVEVSPDAAPTIQVDPLKFASMARPAGRPPKYGFIDKNGKFAVEPQFDQVDSFKEGLAPVAVGKHYEWRGGNWPKPPPQQWGFIDSAGRFIIKANFSGAQQFSQGRAGVQIAEKWGFIDRSGKPVVKPTFESVKMFSDGLAVVERGGKFGCIGRDGRLLVAPKYMRLGRFSNSRALLVMPTAIKPSHPESTSGMTEILQSIRARELMERAGGAFDESEWAGSASCGCHH